MGQPGIDPYLTYAQVRACHRLYEQGQSLRAIARQILPRTRYVSVGSCANALQTQFARLGLPRRDRIEASVAVTRIHGRSRDPEYRAALRRRTGDLDRPLCAGVRQQYPRRGAPCRSHAMAGSTFCAAHDPDRAAARADRMERMRARREAA